MYIEFTLKLSQVLLKAETIKKLKEEIHGYLIQNYLTIYILETSRANSFHNYPYKTFFNKYIKSIYTV